MQIHTTRFGVIHVETDDLLTFPDGLPGLEDCCQWALLTDSQNAILAWLQNLEHPEVALAVTSPRRFIPHYKARVARKNLEGLDLSNPAKAEILVIIGKSNEAWTLNLKAPLVINPDKRLGRQVVSEGDEPVRYEIGNRRSSLKKTA
jgi:flagellar assembly factor FliW